MYTTGRKILSGTQITIAHVQQGIYTFVLEDTLPIATTLIGFAGGLATASFGERTSGGKRTNGKDEETISKEKVQQVVDSLSSPDDKKRFELLLSKK